MQVSMKLCRILDIWSVGFGVISLQLFHNTMASEAFTREACIIEAIGKGSTALCVYVQWVWCDFDKKVLILKIGHL